ncbi:hypothetical protein DsansV1_C16g0141281 [Dioscorea sansibarensis]
MGYIFRFTLKIGDDKMFHYSMSMAEVKFASDLAKTQDFDKNYLFLYWFA